MSFSDFMDTAKHKLGLMSKDEYVRKILNGREDIIDKFPRDERADLRQMIYGMDQLSAMADLPSFLKKGYEIGQRLNDLVERYGDSLDIETKQKVSYVSGIDSIGYRPSGSRIWKFFVNPFAVFSFYAEQHWATKAAIEIIMTEVIHDGFSMVHARGLAPERRAYVEQIFDQFGLWELRLGILKHYLVYGNAIVLPHRNAFQNLQRFELMIMDRAMPVFDKLFEKIIGWDYWTGFHAILYRSEDVLHLGARSLKHPELGLPLLSPLIVDIESDLAASSLNNTVMHKAGMVGTIIALEDPTVANPVNAKNADRLGRRLQREIQMQFSGIKGGQSILVSNYIKGVHKVSQIGEFEGNFLKFRNEIAKAICTVLKVPPEKISINRSAGLQYQAALVEDSINASFDKAIGAYMTIIDRFINQKIIKEQLGIYDIEIEANGRYGSLTLNGARAGLTASQTGGLFTYNEVRSIFYGMPPMGPDDERGYQVCDNSKNRDNTSIPAEYAKEIKVNARGDLTEPSDDIESDEQDIEPEDKKPTQAPSPLTPQSQGNPAEE